MSIWLIVQLLGLLLIGLAALVPGSSVRGVHLGWAGLFLFLLASLLGGAALGYN